MLGIARGVVRAVGSPLLVAGLEHVPPTGPAVVAANHNSYLDPVMLGIALQRAGRAPRHLTKRELFGVPVLGTVLRRLRQVPVDRAGRPAAAIGDAAAELASGQLLVVFPEGTICPEFSPGRAKTGAVRLAASCGAPLVPAAVLGGREVQQRVLRGRPRAAGRRAVPLVVRFGPPLTVTPDEHPAAATRRLTDAVGDLLEAAATTAARARTRRRPGRTGRGVVKRRSGGVSR